LGSSFAGVARTAQQQTELASAEVCEHVGAWSLFE
jgi:hypothetical protein